MAADTSTKPSKTVIMLGAPDHGKTTLLSAITKVLSERGLADYSDYDSIDNAPAYKEGSIEIAAARVEYQSEAVKYTHIDCRSDEDFIKFLHTTNEPPNAAVLVVSAPDGPRPETKEQISLARQRGIPSIVVFLNKCDMADEEELLELVEIEIRELLDRYEYPGDDTIVIQGSALNAINGDEEGKAKITELITALDQYIPAPIQLIDLAFFMPIEEVFSITGKGTYVQGRIKYGKIKTRDPIEIVGIRDTLNSTIVEISVFRKILPEGFPGDQVGLLLREVKEEDVEKGQVVAKRGAYDARKKFQGSIYMLTKEEGGSEEGFKNDYRPQFHFFEIKDVTGTISLPEGVEKVEPGENVTLTIALIEPMVIDAGTTFKIREGGRIVGVGFVSGIEYE